MIIQWGIPDDYLIIPDDIYILIIPDDTCFLMGSLEPCEMSAMAHPKWLGVTRSHEKSLAAPTHNKLYVCKR